MTVSLWIRETVGGRRTYRKPNKKKICADGTIFCFRYSVIGNCRWETLTADNLDAALVARAIKESARQVSEARRHRISVLDTAHRRGADYVRNFC